ncbi:unnamed protein product, partial [Rotaria sp. Silwood1]
LKKYINRSESDFQAAVLDLLVQLLLTRYFIYCIAEFLVMLSHDTLHSKRVIKIQDLIKHYDSLLASGHEPETHTLATLKAVLYDFFYENGLVLVLLIEQFLPLPYISVLRLVELIVYDRIEMMLTLDQQTLNKQL